MPLPVATSGTNLLVAIPSGQLQVIRAGILEDIHKQYIVFQVVPWSIMLCAWWSSVVPMLQLLPIQLHIYSH